LAQLGVKFRVVPVDVDEAWVPQETPRAYALRVALDKARAAAFLGGNCGLPILAADTVVVIDSEVLQKPATRAEGLGMLSRLSDRTHEVISAVVLIRDEDVDTRVSVTRVSFRRISAAEGERYWSSGEPVDKAGGYGIQGLGAVFVSRIEGSYSGVVGLPLFETAELLSGCGIEIP
jgi:septum formation protein